MNMSEIAEQGFEVYDCIGYIIGAYGLRGTTQIRLCSRCRGNWKRGAWANNFCADVIRAEKSDEACQSCGMNRETKIIPKYIKEAIGNVEWANNNSAIFSDYTIAYDFERHLKQNGVKCHLVSFTLRPKTYKGVKVWFGEPQLAEAMRLATTFKWLVDAS